ncbi:hypothetical protein [Thalassobacillus sp. C254]|uniref:hypothetical protein n=1 Tax=Thalassobacillus sp. C254 TaxID=1225341 RepID=UPI0012EECBE9|nr:hypothetical protein [Thalassobacillus sp. C254]
MIGQAFWLVRKELKHNLWAFVFTLVFTALCGVVTMFFLNQLARNEFVTEAGNINGILLDVIFVGMTPSLAALYMSSPYLSFRTVKEDPFNKKMALLRALPIPVSVLTLSRTLAMVIILTVMSIVFYLIITVGLSNEFFTYITRQEFILFILFWFGYALLLGGWNPFVEYGLNGIMLYLSPYIFLLVLLIAIIIISVFTGRGFVEWSFLLIREYGWIAALFSLGAGAAGVVFWNQLLKQRLLKKDFL